FLAAPNGSNSRTRDGHPAAVHRTGVQSPTALAELLRLAEAAAVIRRTRQEHVARPSERVAPHHRHSALVVRRDARLTALAHGAVRRFVELVVGLPALAAVERAAREDLGAVIAQVEPDDVHGARAGRQRVESLARRGGAIVDQRGAAPTAPSIRRAPGNQGSFAA